MIRLFIWLVSLAALGLALTIGLAGPGTRLGLWEYGTGLGLIRTVAMPTMIAAGVSLLALIAALVKERGLLLLPLIALLAAGAAAFVPVQMRKAATSNPFIHDITTDFDNPPQIVAAASEDRNNPPDYVGDEPAPRSEMTTAEAQRDAFPDIQPIETSLSVEDAARTSREVIKVMGMKLLADGPTDTGWRVEAAHTSMWFGFVDDFIVRVEPTESGSVVDVRSKSRVGVSDLGANAARIRQFMKKFEEAAV